MINIYDYIVEKFKISKDIKVDNEDTNLVSVDDENVQDIIDETNKLIHKTLPGYSLIIGDSGDGKHFHIRPIRDLKLGKSMKDKYLPCFLLDDLEKYLGHLYVIGGKISRIDTSSRINNLKRTYWMFYLGEYGEIFNTKAEANKYLKAARNDTDKLAGTGRVFKVMTIKEVSDIKTSIYGAKKENIRFIL